MHSPSRPAPGPNGPDPTRPDPTGPDPSNPDPSDPGRLPVRRLGRASLAWRAAALLIGTVFVVRGTVIGNDAAWPFAPMSQFAFRVGPDDAIHSVFLEARNTRGEILVVPISPRNLGVGRAEIEGQMTRIRQNPALLKDLADSYARIHPDEPPLEQLWLRDRVTDLRNGRAVGEHIEPMFGWPEK